MLDFSFGEILVIAVVAVIFLGPEKLPKAFVDMAKFFRAVKKTINDAKDALDREVHISEIKSEALAYKKQLESGVENITKDISENATMREVKDILNAPLDTPSYKDSAPTMEDIEAQGKKIAAHLKPKNLKDSVDSKDSVKRADSTKITRNIKRKDSAKVSQDSAKDSAKKPVKSAKDSTKIAKDSTKKTSDSAPKTRAKRVDSADSTNATKAKDSAKLPAKRTDSAKATKASDSTKSPAPRPAKATDSVKSPRSKKSQKPKKTAEHS